MNNLSELEQHFIDQGWMVIQLPDPEPIFAIRDSLLQELRKLTGNHEITLETYHQLAADDQKHTEIQVELSRLFRERQYGYKAIAAQADFFKAFLGPDVSVEKEPYLRITRPFKPQDNIGYHRDTSYGGSPFELSVLVPYVNLAPESSLSVLPGSHIRPDSDFPTRQVQSVDIAKGSAKHKLGFPYSPKVLDPAYTQGMKPIPLKVGEALIFCFSTIHGSVENQGIVTRWSSDIRVANSLIVRTLQNRQNTYHDLSCSSLTSIARLYEQINLSSNLQKKI